MLQLANVMLPHAVFGSYMQIVLQRHFGFCFPHIYTVLFSYHLQIQIIFGFRSRDTPLQIFKE